MELKKVRILGKPFHVINMEQTLRYLKEKMEQNEKQFIIAMNPEKIMKCQEDEELSNIIEEKATLLIVDGVGIVIAAKILGLPKIPRVTGVGLFEELVKVAHQDGRSVFLYGASPEVNEKAVKVLKERNPGIKIAGAIHGFEKDKELIIQTIEEAKPDLLFVALGTPGQEKWIAKHIDQLPAKVIMGLGGTFDVLTGNVKRAPVWMQKMGIEWLHRLLKQPTRAGRMMNLPKFMLKVLKNR